METLKKIGAFIACCACVLGAIGGIGWTAYEKAWPIMVGVIVLAGAAAPQVVRWAKFLMKG